ncbi:MAG: hypothetical protein BRC23_00850 [Parcubacteria group bacterium SW_4_49_11]|nr:MAG: hypothetical protein BRC23_00850 [Parcubacteria group bacterium SW_4_49_11]
MDIKTHLKNHQMLWSGGICTILLLLFVGGLVLAAMKPWEGEEGSSSAQISSEQSADSSDSSVPKAPQPSQSEVVTGTITEIEGTDVTVSSLQDESSQTFSLSENTPITLIIAPENPDNYRKESLSISDLRLQDRIDVYVTNNDTVQKVKVTAEEEQSEEPQSPQSPQSS